jgi:LPPG:FO 2-phospho-L-lactate transferase
VWPDFDSVLYALAGIFDEQLGWGRRDDDHAVAGILAQDGWFSMGDRDVALSLLRTAWLGETGGDRAEVARRCRERLDVSTELWPASATPHRTRVTIADGSVSLQEYLVRRRAADEPLRVEQDPRASAAAAPALEALRGADLVVLGPSNPVTSLMPILTVPEIWSALSRAPRIIAVSPTVAATPPRLAPEIGRYKVRERMLAMLGVAHAPDAMAALWPGLVDALVIDHRDAADGEATRIEREGGLPVVSADLLAAAGPPRRALGEAVLKTGLAIPERTDRALAPTPI